MSNLYHCVPSRLLCLPILLDLLFLRSPAMTWSRVIHQQTNKLKWPLAVVLHWTESRFSTNTNTRKGKKTTQAEVRIARPSRGGREVSADIPIRTLSLHSVTPSEKSWVFFWWFPLHDSLHGKRGKEALRFIGFKKTWTLGRSPVSPPMVLNFKICTWTSSELWLGMCGQVRELFSLPDLALETVSK